MREFKKEDISRKFTVLYVEDQMDIQEEFAELLSLYLDQVIVASNGREGLDKYRESLPDLIITDIQMPEMTGLEMIARIRENDTQTPVIVTTAFNENNYLIDAIELGVEHYLLKPVMLDPLNEKLRKVTDSLMQRREFDAYQFYLEERVKEEVTAREAKEAMLLTQNRNAEIGQMVSIIAHQWKQPLHYLNFLIDNIGFEFSQNTLTQDAMDTFVKKGTQRVDFLTETMDTFLRFYKSTTKRKTFMVHHPIEDIIFFLTPPFKSLGIALDVQLEEDFALQGIENEFQQIVLNLLNNAKEAFEGLRKEEAKVRIKVAQKEGMGLVEVSDNAGGIPENIIENIFDMEYTTKADGSGIGLYLVKKIITQRFQGVISVKNSPEGACFSMKFTLAKEAFSEG